MNKHEQKRDQQQKMLGSKALCDLLPPSGKELPTAAVSGGGFRIIAAHPTTAKAQQFPQQLRLFVYSVSVFASELIYNRGADVFSLLLSS